MNPTVISEKKGLVLETRAWAGSLGSNPARGHFFFFFFSLLINLASGTRSLVDHYQTVWTCADVATSTLFQCLVTKIS